MTTSTKEALWLSCKDKTCCSFYAVFPTGLDIWRIATTLRVPPWAFTTLVPAEEGAPDGLVLGRSGQHFRVALAKVPAKGKKLSPCVFLMRLTDGTARCGLGELRPSPCHSFPSLLIDSVLCLMNDGGCTCRKWSLSEMDIGEETAVVMAEKHAREVYYEVVANWNEYVRQATRDESFSYRDFCRYLL